MANKIELRKMNRNMIFRCIHDSGGISRQDIAARTGLSIPTVIQNLSDLEARGLITSDGVFESTGGRRAKVIRCVSDAALAAGIDITQNHLTIVVTDMNGEITCGGVREAFPYEDTEVYYDAVVEKLLLTLKANGLSTDKLLGVGISLPCIVDRDQNIVTYTKILEAPVNIRQLFERRLSIPVEIFNDANSGCMAETWNERSDEMVFYLMLSNSVGGATVFQNQIYLGKHCRSSEIGHVKIVPGGRPCYCGQLGCFNAYCSAKLLSDMTDGSLDTFFSNVSQGRQPFIKTFDEYLDYLAQAVTNLRMLYDCDIILGGYVGRYMEPYMDQLGQKLARLNPYETDCDYVRPTRYHFEASAVGAALPFISRYIDEI